MVTSGTAGQLAHVAFDTPRYQPDGAGGEDRIWVEQFRARARISYARGSEAIEAARLQGRAVYKVRLRGSTESRAVTTDWAMRDLRGGAVFNIREVDGLTDRRWVYLVVETGVAI